MTWLRKLWRDIWHPEAEIEGLKTLLAKRVGSYDTATMHEVRIDRETLLGARRLNEVCGELVQNVDGSTWRLPPRSPENSPEGTEPETPKSL
jgi:hypothetical protein